MVDKIFIKGIQVYAHHGVLKEERTIGQKFVIDVDMFVDLRLAGNTDDLNNTVNYAEVCDLVIRTATQKKFKLIEALAEAVASEIINRFKVKKTKVCVKKPHAPINALLETLGVEIERSAE